MDQLLQKIPLFVIVFIVISIVRAFNQAKAAREKHEAGQDETEEQKRVREIQDRIRRAVAERTGKPYPSAPPVLEQPRSRLPRVPEMQPTDPVGGPVRRIFERLEREAPPPVVAEPVAEVRNAELVRQQYLAGQMRALAESRAVTERREVGRVADLAEIANSEIGMRGAARTRLHEDLVDRQSLRRAIVLREILGTPVGLR